MLAGWKGQELENRCGALTVSGELDLQNYKRMEGEGRTASFVPECLLLKQHRLEQPSVCLPPAGAQVGLHPPAFRPHLTVSLGPRT